jgi:hypothetical protein
MPKILHEHYVYRKILRLLLHNVNKNLKKMSCAPSGLVILALASLHAIQRLGLFALA